MIVLNLGSGRDIMEGAVNLDKVALPGVDVICDLEKFPYPFSDNYFDEVISNHVLEHLDDLVGVMEKLWRICKPGALIKIRVPYFVNPVYYKDPTHKRKFNSGTFDYFSSDAVFDYYSKARLKVESYRIIFLSPGAPFMRSRLSWPLDFFINLWPKFYERFLCYLLPASEIHFLLRVVK